VTNIKTDEPDKAKQFYEAIFGMSLVIEKGEGRIALTLDHD